MSTHLEHLPKFSRSGEGIGVHLHAHGADTAADAAPKGVPLPQGIGGQGEVHCRTETQSETGLGRCVTPPVSCRRRLHVVHTSGTCAAAGKQIPTELRHEEAALRKEIALDDANTELVKSHVDDEYAFAGVKDPKVMVTTARDPSSRLAQFAKVYTRRQSPPPLLHIKSSPHRPGCRR